MIVLTLLTTSKMNQTEVDLKPAKSQFWQVMFIPYIGQRLRGH